MKYVQHRVTTGLKKGGQRFFLFRTRIKILAVFALVMTIASVIVTIFALTNIIPPTGNSNGSRTEVIEGGNILRVSIGARNDEWLLLQVTTNSSSDLYIRGTDEGDMRFYDVTHTMVKCGNWFIVTVFPHDPCLVQFDWTSYNLTQQFDVASFYLPYPLVVFILITLALDGIAVLVAWRSRFEIID